MAVFLVGPGSDLVASASSFDPSGVVRVARQQQSLRLAASASTNWFGYDQGVLEPGQRPFSAISASWRVPAAHQHRAGKAEQSATWIGIGGGCVDARCSLSDPSGLIQTGTEQDVTASGSSQYSAWWELVPLPATTVHQMRIEPGDLVYASVSEINPALNLWRITLRDQSRRQQFMTTAVYPSSRATAEWIEETPLTIGTSGAGTASLPSLTRTPFNHTTVNEHPAHLRPSERVQLVDGSRVIGTPSLPDQQHRGFAACSWTNRCPVRDR